MTWRLAMIVGALVAVLPILALALASWLSKPPKGLGASGGKLAGCPNSPNCVCSFDRDDQHAIAPLPLDAQAHDPLDPIANVLSALPRCRIIERDGGYLRAEFTSALFRFVDDVEFLVDREHGLIHVRSASRVGHSDLGVNRARVEDLRSRLRPPERGPGGR